MINKIITTIFLLGVLIFLGAGCTSSYQQNPNSETPDYDKLLLEEKVGGKKLDLSNQKLTKVPGYIFDRTKLEELDLSNNQLTGAIQSQIGQLKNLKALNAGNNLMTGVPAEVGQLQKLEVLDLSNNQLTGLPNELANLKNLKTLDISGNDYSEHDLEIIQKGLPEDVNIIK